MMSKKFEFFEICDPKKCLICYRPAWCNNYGALTCDACKMFFRRVVTEKLVYSCKLENCCFEGFTAESGGFPKCKSCRYQRCLDHGMSYILRETRRLIDLKIKKEDENTALIANLIHRDAHRATITSTCFTVKNPTLLDLVEKNELKIYTRTKKDILRPQDWSFFALYTTVEFFCALPFMRKLSTVEKLILLKSSAAKCGLFCGAMRTFREKYDRMVTVDGQDIYPDAIRTVFRIQNGSEDFLNRIRSGVVSKLIELNLTNEEYVLISAIVFCNPMQEGLSESAVNIITAQQNQYNAALFEYCQFTYQHSAPSRFTELLALCPIIQRNFEDLKYLTMMFRFATKGTELKFRNIVEELI